MVSKFNGYRRLTFKFASGWSHLDQYEFVGEFRELVSPRVRYSDDGETRERRITFVAPRGISGKVAREVIREHLSFGCRCEHDCCGHWQGTARDVRRIRGRRFTALLHEYRNV